MPRMYMRLSGRATLSGELPRPFIAAHGPKSPRKVQNHYLVAVSALLPSFLSLSAWFHVPIYPPSSIHPKPILQHPFLARHLFLRATIAVT